jgi:branched-chain amino acid transport system permease protein
MEAFLGQFLGGIATGGIYASLALALVMIYQATHHINFAQGEMAMFSAFVAWAFLQAGFPYWAAFGITVVFSFLVGAVIQVAVMRPMANAPVLSVVTVSVGLLVIFHSLAGWLFGYTIQQFPSPFPRDAWYGGRFMSTHQVGSIAVVGAIVVLLFGFFRFTSLGLAMRAAAENPVSARLVGVPVDRMLILGWGLAAAVGAVAGMMVAPITYLDPSMMTGALLYGFAGALLGGITSPLGAVVGGFIVGVAENLLGSFVVGTELKLSVALALIVLVLIVRPSGLMGRVVVTRV